ncbi:MAG: DinB family protein [Anaerolineales bacterium]|nr:DinB family protein [Anaerolineales bacterium]
MATIRNKVSWERAHIEREIYQELIEEMSERLAREIAPLTDAQVGQRPGPHLNPISYLVFHILRSWERDLNHLILGQPQAEDAWHRLGLVEETGFDPSGTGYNGWANGTGYTDAQVDGLPAGKAWLQRYHAGLMAETSAYLAGVSEDFDEFGREIHHENSPFNPFTPRWRLQHLITHSHRHIGDIQFVKGMLGMSDATYPGVVDE